MQSISSRSILAFCNACSTSAKGLVLRPPFSKAEPHNRELPPGGFSKIATLRSCEENSSAKIFINNAPLRFIYNVDSYTAEQLIWIRDGQVVARTESLDPLDHRHSARVINILFQPCANNLLAL